MAPEHESPGAHSLIYVLLVIYDSVRHVGFIPWRMGECGLRVLLAAARLG